MPTNDPKPPIPTHKPNGPAAASAQRRHEAAILRLIGVFFLVLTALVLVSLFWNQDFQGRVVSVGAASVLGLVGVVLILFARKRRWDHPELP